MNHKENKILITLCARGGSKGIPGKNIKLINGLPLIAYSIEVAKNFAKGKQAKIALSTDSQEIKEVAASFGVMSDYSRPAEYSQDDTGKIDTIKHVLEYEESLLGSAYDLVLDLDITSPFRNLNDLEQAYQLVLSDSECYNLFSVSKAHRNPYFNMVEQQENGYFDLIKKGIYKTRQSAPPVYDLNASFYFYKKSFFDKAFKTAITDRSQIYVMPHQCFDLDHPVDFEFMEFLLKTNKLDFQL